MNYIRHIQSFYYHVKRDDRLSPGHISLYMAIFQYWNYNHFQNPFRINRDELMLLSKIGSKNTYHRCIKELHQAGYIHYNPPTARFQPVKLSMTRLDLKDNEKDDKQLDLFGSGNIASGHSNAATQTEPNNVYQSDLPPNNTAIFNSQKFVENGKPMCTDNGTDPVPILTIAGIEINTAAVSEMGHLIKHKQINGKHCVSKTEIQTHKQIFDKNKIIQKAITNMAGPNDAKNKQLHTAWRQPKMVVAISKNISEPGEKSDFNLAIVENYFIENNFEISEAQNFFYYNQGRGWMLTEKMPVKDWRALAQKWMLNNAKIKLVRNDRPFKEQKQHINPGAGKDYSEPL